MQHKLGFSPAPSWSGGASYLVPSESPALLILPAADDTTNTCESMYGWKPRRLYFCLFFVSLADVDGKAFRSRAKTWTGLIRTNGFALFFSPSTFMQLKTLLSRRKMRRFYGTASEQVLPKANAEKRFEDNVSRYRVRDNGNLN